MTSLKSISLTTSTFWKRTIPWACALALVVVSCSDDPVGLEPPPTPPPGTDVTAPEQIDAASWSYPAEGGPAILSWIAPRDDNASEAVTEYEIRYSYSFPFDWDLSIAIGDAPTPGAPGTAETYALTAPQRGRDLYAAIRSRDEAGNRSKVSSIAHIHITGHTVTGTCIAGVDGAPLEALDITVTARHVFERTTDVFGVFSVDNLTAGTVNIAVRNGASTTLFHNINDVLTLDRDLNPTYTMIPYQPFTDSVFENAFQIFIAVSGLGSHSTVFKKWRSFPVTYHVPAYVNAFGLDYAATCHAAVDRWEEASGIDLFIPVASYQEAAIDVVLVPTEDIAPLNAVTAHINDSEGFPIGETVTFDNSFQQQDPLYRIFLHEMGHTIRLNHLGLGRYIMWGSQPLPADIHAEEAMAVQIYVAMPNDFDIDPYDSTSPND
jgi:hypothetical protein